MTLIQGRGRLAQKSRISKAPIGLLSHRSDNEDYKDSLGSNKARLSKAIARLFQTPPPPKAPKVARYMQKNKDHLLQTFFQVLKGGSEDKFKAKSFDVYCSRSHIKCYNFCQ